MSMEDVFHTKSIDETLKAFNVSIDEGLSEKEVESRLKKYGLNGSWSFLMYVSELPRDEGKPLWKHILEQFDDLLVKILLIAAVISFVSCYSSFLSIRI